MSDLNAVKQAILTVNKWQQVNGALVPLEIREQLMTVLERARRFVHLADRPDNDLAHVLDTENFHLWDDLEKAMKRAVNGRWSMECDWIVERIVMLERVGALRPERASLTFEDDRWVLAEASVNGAGSSSQENPE